MSTNPHSRVGYAGASPLPSASAGAKSTDAAPVRNWRLRLLLWLAPKAGLTAHKYSVSSVRGGPIDKSGLMLLDKGAADAMGASFRVGFCNVAQSFLDEAPTGFGKPGKMQAPDPWPDPPERVPHPTIPVTEVRDRDVIELRVCGRGGLSVVEAEAYSTCLKSKFPGVAIEVLIVPTEGVTGIGRILRPAVRIEVKGSESDAIPPGLAAAVAEASERFDPATSP